MAFFDKALSIVPGDIVSVTNGRSWLRAKVMKTLPENMLLVRFKGGRTTKVSAEHVLTEEEKKNFRKAKGQTNIIRDNAAFDNSEDAIEENNSSVQDQELEEKKSRFNKLF